MNLKCGHFNAANWTFNGGDLPDKVLILPDFSLRINIVEAYHAGTYICTSMYSDYIQYRSSIDLVVCGKFYDFVTLLSICISKPIKQ